MSEEELEAKVREWEGRFTDIIMDVAALKNESGFLYQTNAGELVRAFSDYMFDVKKTAREGALRPGLKIK